MPELFDFPAVFAEPPGLKGSHGIPEPPYPGMAKAIGKHPSRFREVFRPGPKSFHRPTLLAFHRHGERRRK